MQRYIYIRSTETIIPCTDEEFQEYYRALLEVYGGGNQASEGAEE